MWMNQPGSSLCRMSMTRDLEVTGSIPCRGKLSFCLSPLMHIREVVSGFGAQPGWLSGECVRPMTWWL